MKLAILLISGIILLNSHQLHAQQPKKAAEEVEPAVTEEDPHQDYTVIKRNELTINGQPYVQIDLSPKVQPPFQCPSNTAISLNRALLMVNMASTIAAGVGVLKVSPRQDKLRHALAGYMVGNVTTGTLLLILPDDTKNRKLLSALSGLGASVLVGVGKEVRDTQGYGTPDKMDAVVTALGGLGGTFTISVVDVKKATKKKQRVPTF